MNIALFTDTYLPDINGVVSSVVLLKKKLEEQGNEVWVVTNYKGVSKILVEDHIIRLPGIELKGLYGYKVTQPMHLLFIDELKDLHFDIIHAQQEFGVGVYASIVAKVLHIPLVRTYHTAYEDYTSYFLPVKNEIVDEAAKKIIEGLSLIVGEDCLRMVAPSKKTKEMLERYGITTKIEVIPTGLELNGFKPENQDREKVKSIRKELGFSENELMFIYIGRIGSEKSIDILINGFKKIKMSNLPGKLVIVGGGPDEDALHELVKKLNLEDTVLFTGKKPHEEVPLYYNAADVFVSASITETQGMTYVEAMASGLPLICRKDEVLEDVLIDSENGYFFLDADDFSNKAIRFIKLKENERKSMSDYSLEIADLYDADKFGLNMQSMYEEAIEDYDSSFYIEKINVKEDVAVVKLASNDINEKITVSLDTYLDLGLRTHSRMTRDIYEKLKKEEESTLAYKSALKKLAMHDTSEKGMRDYLYTKFNLNENETEALMNKLKMYDFINDEKFVFNKVNSYSGLLYSGKMMKNKLKEYGISKDIIEKYVHTTPDEELVKAKKLSEKYNLLIHGKSLKARKDTIIRKLVENGYTMDTALQAVEFIDFSLNSLEETEILKIEALKAKIRYARKYKGRELRNHIFQSLASKGFEYNLIYAVLDEMEAETDES